MYKEYFYSCVVLRHSAKFQNIKLFVYARPENTIEKKLDNFNHLKHNNKKYQISARITKYFCNSYGNC